MEELKIDEKSRGKHDLANQLSTILARAHESILKSQEKYIQQANKHRKPQEFKVGQQVWLNRKGITVSSDVQRPSTKLLFPWIGPFKILEEGPNPDTFKLELPTTMKIHPIFHTNVLKPFYDGSQEFPTRKHEPPPPPVIIKGEEEFFPEKILDERTFRKKKQYLVKWVGYDEPEWNDAENMEETEVLDKYLISNPSTTTATKRVTRSRRKQRV